MDFHERTAAYIESLDTGNTAFLDELEKYSLETFVPIIKKPVQNFLKLIISIKKPKRILEVGTAVGFSSILMAEYSDDDCHITTIEKYEKRFPIAEENFLKSGYKDKITFIKGDATEVLEELVKKGEIFDFIFMDAAKGQYINFFPNVMKLLAKDGVLISDNALQDNELIQSKYAVTRRNRTIHKRMREYLFNLTHNEELVTSIIPIGDGITISSKK
ncbi:MAG: O-methyltransferase [Lachnospiraceae bacterium]|nr:O-methyltransferase [Lachnospiraceae bacterium]